MKINDHFAGRYFFCTKYSISEKIREGRNSAIWMLNKKRLMSDKKNMEPK
jgi:hypothetical protein